MDSNQFIVTLVPLLEIPVITGVLPGFDTVHRGVFAAKTELVYGSPNIGSKGTTTYTIDHLEVGKRYYFNIKAINECEPGDFSNTVSIVVGAKPDDTLQKLPNLSLYKTVLGASTSAKKNKHTTAGVLVTSPYCSSCFGLPVLLLQTGILLLYLFLSHKINFLRQVYAVVIPILFYLGFSFFGNNCSPNMFFCKYYLQLSLISFIGTVILYKYKILHKKIEHREELFIKPNVI